MPLKGMAKASQPPAPMYGLVNRAIQELIVSQHGHGVWQSISRRAGWDCSAFIGMQTYDDEITYRLVQAASQELEVPAAELLEAFGTYWIRFTAAEGYGPLLDASGQTFEELLANLDEMHARISLAYPDLDPPTFSVESSSKGSWSLRYESRRTGLAPMVVGLLRGLAERFGKQVQVTFEEENTAGKGASALFWIEEDPSEKRAVA